ncbi:MAG: hypothetical protein PHH16_03395 [Candidatus Gracilibacteria bacterium]|nr:hypothetical protein [Candidatus Gracilibacteria bacterium]
MFGFLFGKKQPAPIIQAHSLMDFSKETDIFFRELSEEFSFLLFDEILILRKLRSGYEFVHHQEYGKKALADRVWKDRVIGNIDFFLNRIMKKNALADGEGVFTWNQEGALFDVMVREGDYYIALNNSSESLKSLMQKHPFDEEKLIEFLGKFADHFNNKTGI